MALLLLSRVREGPAVLRAPAGPDLSSFQSRPSGIYNRSRAVRRGPRPVGTETLAPGQDKGASWVRVPRAPGRHCTHFPGRFRFGLAAGLTTFGGRPPFGFSASG